MAGVYAHATILGPKMLYVKISYKAKQVKV